MSESTAIVSSPGRERWGRTPFGAPILVHMTSDQTNGAFGMWETITPPGQGPAPRSHHREFEVFRVLRGTYRFWCNDDPPFDAPPGSVVAIPPGRRHAWQNVSDETGQMTVFVTPGGLEQLFVDIAELDSPTMQQIAVIEQRLGITNDEVGKLS